MFVPDFHALKRSERGSGTSSAEVFLIPERRGGIASLSSPCPCLEFHALNSWGGEGNLASGTAFAKMSLMPVSMGRMTSLSSPFWDFADLKR